MLVVLWSENIILLGGRSIFKTTRRIPLFQTYENKTQVASVQLGKTLDLNL